MLMSLRLKHGRAALFKARKRPPRMCPVISLRITTITMITITMITTTIRNLTDINEGLSGSSVRLGKPHRNLKSDPGYSYQVDVFVEVDYDLCDRNGETCANGLGLNTMNYMNSLFAGANSMYEVRVFYSI